MVEESALAASEPAERIPITVKASPSRAEIKHETRDLLGTAFTNGKLERVLADVFHKQQEPPSVNRQSVLRKVTFSSSQVTSVVTSALPCLDLDEAKSRTYTSECESTPKSEYWEDETAQAQPSSPSASSVPCETSQQILIARIQASFDQSLKSGDLLAAITSVAKEGQKVQRLKSVTFSTSRIASVVYEQPMMYDNDDEDDVQEFDPAAARRRSVFSHRSSFGSSQSSEVAQRSRLDSGTFAEALPQRKVLKRAATEGVAGYKGRYSVVAQRHRAMTEGLPVLLAPLKKPRQTILRRQITYIASGDDEEPMAVETVLRRVERAETNWSAIAVDTSELSNAIARLEAAADCVSAIVDDVDNDTGVDSDAAPVRPCYDTSGVEAALARIESIAASLTTV